MLKMTVELTETSADHTADSEEEEAIRKRLAAVIDEDNVIVDKEAARKARDRICSCGYFTCSLVPQLGLPVPLFKSDVEPLFPQSRRDKRARQLVQEGN